MGSVPELLAKQAVAHCGSGVAAPQPDLTDVNGVPVLAISDPNSRSTQPEG